MERVILVRHGQTATNTKELLHLKGDKESLTELGITQMKETTAKLREFLPSKVYTSAEQRAIDSAEIVANGLGIPLKTIAGIEERNWGEFSGGPWDKIAVILGPMTLAERYLYAPPGGESWQQFEERLIKALDEILSQNKDKTVVIVTHAGVIRALMPQLLGVKQEDTFKYNPDNASITIFDHQDGKFSKITINDTRHLE